MPHKPPLSMLVEDGGFQRACASRYALLTNPLILKGGARTRVGIAGPVAKILSHIPLMATAFNDVNLLLALSGVRESEQ